MVSAAVLGGFVVYATWAAFQDANDYPEPYLYPVHSPCIAARCEHVTLRLVGNWWRASPPILILIFPLGSGSPATTTARPTAGPSGSPPPCTVAEPHRRYSGESRFPLVPQNVHRYFLYPAALFVGILSYDALRPTPSPTSDQHQGVHRGIDVFMECTVIRLLLDAGRIAGAFGHWPRPTTRWRGWAGGSCASAVAEATSEAWRAGGQACPPRGLKGFAQPRVEVMGSMVSRIRAAIVGLVVAGLAVPAAAEAAAPDIEVSTLEVDFGQAWLENPHRSRSFVLANTGTADLTGTIETSGPPFAAGEVRFRIAPGLSHLVVVEFFVDPPSPGTYQGTLTIRSNDPDQPTVTITLTGEIVESGPFFERPPQAWGFFSPGPPLTEGTRVRFRVEVYPQGGSGDTTTISRVEVRSGFDIPSS